MVLITLASSLVNSIKAPLSSLSSSPSILCRLLPSKMPFQRSPWRYNLTIQSMIEFHLKIIQFNFWFKRKLLKMIQFNFWFKSKLLKMIQFNFWFKGKLSKMIQFNFQFKRKLSGFNSKKLFNQKKTPEFNSKKYSIQNYSGPIQFNKIFNSKLFWDNSIQ